MSSHARRLPAVVVAAGAGLLVACAPPAGLDGDLVGQWEGMPEPVVFVPEADVCHGSDFPDVTRLGVYEPVSCGRIHWRETIHVGAFTGEAGERVFPPDPGSPEMVEAYAECAEVAAEFLAGDFRTARLHLGVSKPSRSAWDGGARWFHCDLAVFESVDREARQAWIGSLRDELDGGSSLRFGCFDPELNDDDEIDAMGPVDCDEPHSAEFVGIWDGPDAAYPDLDNEDTEERVFRECRTLIGEYVDVPDDEVVFLTGVIYTPPAESEWELGNRGYRCYLWLGDREVSRSLEDAGRDGIPA